MSRVGREQAAAASSKQQAAGSRQQATSSRQQVCEVRCIQLRQCRARRVTSKGLRPKELERGCGMRSRVRRFEHGRCSRRAKEKECAQGVLHLWRRCQCVCSGVVVAFVCVRGKESPARPPPLWRANRPFHTHCPLEHNKVGDALF